MNPRNGKIAHLPRSIRDLLNDRLDRSQPASQILPWLNALEEVREIIKGEFEGIPIGHVAGFQAKLASDEPIAAYVLAVQRGDVKAKLDIQPTDTFGEGPIKAPRNRNRASATKPKPLAHKKMKCAHQSKPTQPHSGELKANQSDFAPLVHVVHPVHEVHASAPIGPIHPILPIIPIPLKPEK
jgi:hypothetical protein